MNELSQKIRYIIEYINEIFSLTHNILTLIAFLFLIGLGNASIIYETVMQLKKEGPLVLIIIIGIIKIFLYSIIIIILINGLVFTFYQYKRNIMIIRPSETMIRDSNLLKYLNKKHEIISVKVIGSNDIFNKIYQKSSLDINAIQNRLNERIKYFSLLELLAPEKKLIRIQVFPPIKEIQNDVFKKEKLGFSITNAMLVVNLYYKFLNADLHDFNKFMIIESVIFPPSFLLLKRETRTILFLTPYDYYDEEQKINFLIEVYNPSMIEYYDDLFSKLISISIDPKDSVSFQLLLKLLVLFVGYLFKNKNNEKLINLKKDFKKTINFYENKYYSFINTKKNIIQFKLTKNNDPKKNSIEIVEFDYNDVINILNEAIQSRETQYLLKDSEAFEVFKSFILNLKYVYDELKL